MSNGSLSCIVCNAVKPKKDFTLSCNLCVDCWKSGVQLCPCLFPCVPSFVNSCVKCHTNFIVCTQEFKYCASCAQICPGCSQLSLSKEAYDHYGLVKKRTEYLKSICEPCEDEWTMLKNEKVKDTIAAVLNKDVSTIVMKYFHCTRMRPIDCFINFCIGVVERHQDIINAHFKDPNSITADSKEANVDDDDEYEQDQQDDE